MTTISFHKMHGLSNDFIVIDAVWVLVMDRNPESTKLRIITVFKACRRISVFASTAITKQIGIPATKRIAVFEFGIEKAFKIQLICSSPSLLMKARGRPKTFQ